MLFLITTCSRSRDLEDRSEHAHARSIYQHMKEFALSAIKSVRNIYFMLFLVVSGMYHTGLYSWNTSSVVVKKSIPMKGIILRLYLREFHCN